MSAWSLWQILVYLTLPFSSISEFFQYNCVPEYAGYCGEQFVIARGMNGRRQTRTVKLQPVYFLLQIQN